jgi:hypothetical protein
MRRLTRPTYRGHAQAQGVLRPFEILVRMPHEGRRLIADLLHCEFRPFESPDAQAWRIINQNLRGLQARTHRLPEQLSPFARNNNWWEIVTRTARRLGIEFYPGLRDQEVEALLFERLADLFVQEHLADGQDAVDVLTESHPEFAHALRSLRLSRNGARTVLSAIAMAAARADESLRESLQKVGEWIRSGLRWSWTATISSCLSLLQQQSTEIYRTWLRCGFSRRLTSNSARVSAAVAVIYFQDLVDRTLEEFELVRG